MKIKKNAKYNGIVCSLTDVKPHPNADRLQVARALGYDVVVGLEAKEGDLGICFPEGGKLSHEMCLHNSLYRKDPVTGEKMGGYFGENGRVKSTKLRGVHSEAFFTSLDSLVWAGQRGFVELKEGTEIGEIDGQKICEKYYTRATLRAMNRAKKNYKKPKWLPKFLVPIHKKYVVNKVKRDPCPDFKKHFSTTKLRQYSHMIPEGLNAIITSKMHGTSGRTGYVKYDTRRFLGRLLKRPVKYQYVTGTRNVVKNPIGYGESKDDGYYAGTTFRQRCHSIIQSAGLYKDEVVYYEIVGFESEGKPIMPNHKLDWKDFKDSGFSKKEFQQLVDQFSETITYHYGQEDGECEIRVYRITNKNVDLSDQKMRQRCQELGLQCVSKLTEIDSGEDLMGICKDLSEESDMQGQLREGVCVRLEDLEGKLVKIVKYKSNRFAILEGIKRNDVDYVDMEEIN